MSGRRRVLREVGIKSMCGATLTRGDFLENVTPELYRLRDKDVVRGSQRRGNNEDGEEPPLSSYLAGLMYS